MNDKLQTGLSAEFCRVVERKDLASEVGSGLVNVFSTAMLVAGMEEAAVKAVQNALLRGQTTVGLKLDITHLAPTPIGMQICFKAVLEKISESGRGLEFHVQARDEKEIIGEGSHKRVIVDQAGFEQKAAAKCAGGK